MLAAPELRDLLTEAAVELARTRDQGGAQRHPGEGSKNEDGGDGEETGDGHLVSP